jgi:TonB family protein
MIKKITSEEVSPTIESVATEKVAPLKEEMALPDEVDQPKSAKRLKIVEEPIAESPAQDTYITDRDSYNRQISKLLLDVSYALQIFRTGMIVKLEVSIDPSGTVVNQKIIKSSGSHDFDDTTIMSLEEIQFDPLPETMLKYGNYIVILQIQNSR